MRVLFVLFFAICNLGLASQPGYAQGRSIVFGDSLSDNGNWNAVTGNPGGFFPLNADGGASNGPLWAEQLFGPQNSPVQGTGVLGNVNMAYIGARSDALITPSPPHVPGAIGIPTQIVDYLAAGGTIGSSDVVTVWAGANNVRECIDNPAVCLPAAGDTLGNAAAAANSQLASVQTLIGLGGRTILVPNHTSISATPFYPDGSPQQADALASANVFNSVLFSGLQQVAANAPAGTNVIHADVNAVQKLVRSNPGAFGFTNVDDRADLCFPACNPNEFYFWDFIHPTAAVHGLYALYFSLLLDTSPAILDQAPLGESLHRSTELITNAVFDRLSNWISGTYVMKNGPYVEALGQLGRYSDNRRGADFDLDLGGLRVGWDQRLDNTLIGASLAFVTGDQEASNLSSDVSIVRGDAYGTHNAGAFYGTFNVGFGGLWFDDVVRRTGFGPVIANSVTDGYTASAAIEVGMVQKMGVISLIPSARLSYVHAHLNGYQERAPILALDFNDQDSDALLGRVSVRAVSRQDFIGWPTAFFAELGYEGYLAFSGNKITATLANNTALPTVVSPGDPNGPGFLGKLGLSSQISEAMFIDVNYGVSIHESDGETHSGRLRLKAHF